MTRTTAPNGIAFVVLLPWLLTAVGLVVAFVAWVEPNGSPTAPPPVASDDPAEAKTLRLALATASAENAALRGELDRLLTRGGRASVADDGAKSSAAGGAATSGASAPKQDTSELSARISESLSRAAAGDKDSAREGAMAMMQVLQGGPQAMEALQQAYLSTADPKAKLMMLPTMLFGGGEAARDFIAEQVRTETDPELRSALIRQAAGFATPKYADQLKDTFLQAASTTDDPSLRAAAVRGLRYAKGQDVQEFLLSAASDPSEEIRLAAIENLASRPALRNELQSLIAQDSSTHVREIGQCRLLLAESGMSQ